MRHLGPRPGLGAAESGGVSPLLGRPTKAISGVVRTFLRNIAHAMAEETVQMQPYRCITCTPESIVLAGWGRTERPIGIRRKGLVRLGLLGRIAVGREQPILDVFGPLGTPQ